MEFSHPTTLNARRRHLHRYVRVLAAWLADPDRSDQEALETGRRLVHGLADALDNAVTDESSGLAA